MTPACQTISTAAADYVSFATDNFAGVKVIHIGSDRDDFAQSHEHAHECAVAHANTDPDGNVDTA